MATGDILRGRTALPIYGKNGTLLYATPIGMTCSIVVSWTGGRDVDICGFFTHYAGAKIGYSYGAQIDDGNGFTANWTSGDNTSGGPETVSLAYSGATGLAGKSFEIHANWFAVGEDETGGGPATVTATDAAGTTKTFTVMPGTSKGRAATPADPGCMINFNTDGTLKSITAA